MRIPILLFLGATLACVSSHLRANDINFREVEIPFYTFAEFTPQSVLRVPYAGFEIAEPEAWLSKRETHVAYEIDLVFTKYPADIDAWRTDYHQLLHDRIDELRRLDSELVTETVRWNVFLQTQCRTEEEAKRYFHGFVIKYRPRTRRIVEEVRGPADLRDLITGEAAPRDSTVLHVMNRRSEWRDMLVVTDWTGSMYQFGAQLVLWHKQNLAVRAERCKHLLFFNDGNRLPYYLKEIGSTGGIYYTRADEIGEILRLMAAVMRRGNGGDRPENDLEAVLKGQNLLSDYGDIVLIADNTSSVRDLRLIEKINHPVRIILCGVPDDGWIHPDYIRIAQETGGSLHTARDDHYFYGVYEPGSEVLIGPRKYVLEKTGWREIARN